MLRALLRRWAAGSSMHAAATEVAVASGKSFSRVHDGSACAHDSAAGGAGGQAQQHAVPRPCNCHPPPSRPIAVRMRPAALSSPPGCAASSWYLHSSTSNALNKPDWPITTCAGMVVAQQRPAAAVACAVTPAPWATVRRCHFQRPLATGAPAQPAARHTAGASRRQIRVVASAAASAGDSAPVPPPRLFATKVASLAVIFLCATVNYTILQTLRDALIVTSCGAEALPFISACGVLPASLAFFMYYDKLVNALDSKAVFYWALAPLVAFYGLFAAVLLPNASWLHPTALAEHWIAALPESVSCFVKVAANWSYTLFFIVAELWGSVAISLLFWSLADDVCSVDEATNVYPKLGILANAGLIAAGSFVRFVTEVLARGNEQLGLQLLVLAIVATSCLMCAVKSFMDVRVLPFAHSDHAAPPKRKDKKKGGAKKQGAMEVLKSSSRIRNLTLMVAAFAITHKLFGFTWKAAMKQAYPSTSAYAALMGDVASLTGATTIALMLVSKFIFQYLGWRGAALVTPIVCLGAGALFFAGALWPLSSVAAGGPAAALLALAPAAGIVAQVFGRGSKYSLFDPAKEMLFIVMPPEEKAMGKAAVDVLGNQLAKSGGSWLMQGALLVCGSMAAAMPFTAAVYVAVCLVWVKATLDLANTMDGPKEEEQVLASIDATPLLEPVAPGKVLAPAAPGQHAGLTPEQVAAHTSQLEADVKESMQSKWDD